MESEDTDRNRFVLDVTKTAFLREGFSISRVGGSTVDGANSPTASSEKGEKSKRASSRPSSGKVGVTQSGNKIVVHARTRGRTLLHNNALGGTILSYGTRNASRQMLYFTLRAHLMSPQAASIHRFRSYPGH